MNQLMDNPENDDPDGWRPYCDDEMSSYEGETDPDG